MISVKKKKNNIKNKPVKRPYNLESYLLNENLGFKANRRGFFKFIGYSFSALVLTNACKQKPIRQMIRKTPSGQQYQDTEKIWFYSTCQACTAGCPIMIKTVNQQVIKLEGNRNSTLTSGGLCAFGQASIQGLYSETRNQNPFISGQQVNWDKMDEEIILKLTNISEKNGKIILLTNTINSPSTQQVIQNFSLHYGNTAHITWDTVSSYAIMKSYEKCFGEKMIPSFLFDRAKTIVSFGADFLGSWISPVEFTKDYMLLRDIDNKRELSYHVQVESIYTLTGANADKRIVIRPSEERIFLMAIYNEIAQKAEKPIIPLHDHFKFTEEARNLATKLWFDKGQSMVISNSNDIENQVLIIVINRLLGNYGHTISLENASHQKTGNEELIIDLVKKMNQGQIEAMIIQGNDPMSYFPAALKSEFLRGLKKVNLTISFCGWNESIDPAIAGNMTAYYDYICPDNHYLESWNDHHPKEGLYSISQPAIPQRHNTRQFQQSLLKWSGTSTLFSQYLKNYWKDHIFSNQNKFADFDAFWNHIITTGVYEPPLIIKKKYLTDFFLENEAIQSIKNMENISLPEIILFETTIFRNGSQPGNTLMLELPDPITKNCWDHSVTVSMATAHKYALKTGDVIRFDLADNQLFTIHIQEGQADETIGIPLLFTNDFRNNNQLLAYNSFSMVNLKHESYQYSGFHCNFVKSGKRIQPANTQTENDISPPKTVRELSVNEFLTLPFPPVEEPDRLFEKNKTYKLHHWAMVIDLNLCTGCSACMVSCMIENNVPVTGEKQVRKRNEMHWLRIDRYYDQTDPLNQKVNFMPVLCQHCNNAPCEPVCPVSATTNSSEGINYQIYQRCIGSRYCAANCPYQVRKFNFYDYFNDEDYQRFNIERIESLNPDVCIREKGVIEKCSFCFQRIQEAKNKVKSTGKSLMDGEIKMACEQSCPANAITFGDLNDHSSRIYSLLKSKRANRLLSDLNTNPAVIYLAKVRNNNERSIL